MAKKDDANKADAETMVETVAARVAEMVQARLDEITKVLNLNNKFARTGLDEIREDVLRLGRDTEKLDNDQSQMRKSFADNIQEITDQVRGLTPDGLIDEATEILKPRMQEMVADVMGRIDEGHKETQAAIEKLDADQKKMNDALALLSETYEDVKALTSTDWREYAGEEFIKAEENALELKRARKAAMAKLGKYERDTSVQKRATDPHYAKLKVDANNATDKSITAKRKVSAMKDAAMQAVAA